MYKLKHTPTGLYYQPHKHRGSNLSKRGKIYQTNTHGLSRVFKMFESNPDGNKGRNSLFTVFCEKDSQIYKQTKDILVWVDCSWSYNQIKAETNLSDWIIENI
jgi:hypothetical protein